MDIFDQKKLKPMLIGSNRPPFDSDDFIYELKLDGIRALAYLSPDGVSFRNKRNKNLDAIYPELMEIHKQVKTRCILDGELLVLRDGRPDFYELQRRSLMTNQFRIKLAAENLPVCFTAFDILFYGDHLITDMPLMERKEKLENTVIEDDRLAVSRIFERDGIALFDRVRENGLEGIVAKRKSSKYYFGKTTKDWIKCKALLDDDFVVCGYYMNEQRSISVILGIFEGNRLVYQGHVVMSASNPDFDIMRSVKEGEAPPGFPAFDETVWKNPELVCKVSFMEYMPGGGLRQPTYRGLRDDKLPEECVK